MSTETVYAVVNAALAMASILSFALVGIFFAQKVKALAKKEWKTAVLYDTAERLFIGMACVLLVVLLLNADYQDAMSRLFVLKSKLEVLTR